MKTNLRSILKAAAIAATTLVFPACDSDDDNAAAGTTESNDGSSGAAAACPSDGTSCPDGDSGTTASQVRPPEAEAVIAAIEAGSYADWEAEPMVHPPGEGSPHPNDVRTFFNPELATSMGANNTEHPVGAAAVKESWDGDELIGWFIEVKIAEGTGPETWYWWSDIADVDTVGAVGVGCSDCHAAGVDYVTTSYPFQ